MPTLSVGDCIRFGWETFKKRPGILIAALILLIAIPLIPRLLVPPPEVTPGGGLPHWSAAQSVALLVHIVMLIFAGIGGVTFVLRAHDDIFGAKLADLWNPAPFWRYLGAGILSWIIQTVGFILLIVPGVIAALGLCFSPYFVIDRGAGPIEALKMSWRATRGYKWRLFLLSLAMLGLNVLGLLALGVGLLVSIPVSFLALVHAYRTLQAGAQS